MTTPFETFVAPARARPQLWRLVLGLVLAVAVYVGWTFLVLAGAYLLLRSSEEESLFLWFHILTVAGRPGDMLIILGTFAGMILGPFAAVWIFGKRSAWSLFGQNGHRGIDFWMMVLLLALLAVPSMVVWMLNNAPVQNLGLTRWLMFLPFGLLGVALQTLAEEVMFRGYLMQTLAARFRSPIVWMGLPTVLFGALHFDPSAGSNAWLIVAATGYFGLIAADLTARSGSIFAAWGLHFANNTIAILILGTSGAYSGLALFVTPYGAAAPQNMTDILAGLVVLTILWGLGRLYLRRYG